MATNQSRLTRFKNAWNTFRSAEEKVEENLGYIMGPATYGYRGDQQIFRGGGQEQSITDSICTRIAIDVAAIDIFHVKTDDSGRYLQNMTSGLQECLTLSANIDQTARQFKQDLAMSLLQTGTIALVPVDTTADPGITGSYDIQSMRVGAVVTWYPRHVRVSLYNDRTGNREEVTLPKEQVAIVVNPLYAVMNETNSTLQRLVRKLHLLDAVDAQSGSGKLDIIIQLPYTIRSEAKKTAADLRKKDLEAQLSDSRYGIAYADASEKITQLNRPAENNLLKQVEYLTEMLYGQLGITQEVLNGTADEKTMLNYYNRTVEPILTSIKESMKRTFLTKTARTQGQDILFFRDPFRLVPITQLAEIGDKFTRNEILSSNEMRGIIGFKPVLDKKADELRNKNLPEIIPEGDLVDPERMEDGSQNGT